MLLQLTNKMKMMFELYARFCASYALEVIVCFVTMIVAAITLNMTSPYDACEWVFKCNEGLVGSEQVRSDVILLLIVRCGSIVSTFVQIKKVFQSGSNFILLVITLNIIFSIVTFSVTVFHFLHKDIVSDALPVFLLFIDFSRMLTLAKHSMSTRRVDTLHDKIAVGMGELMPGLTRDVIFKFLSISSLAYQVPIYQIQQIGCFACLSVAINYLVFITFVPACLSLSLTWIAGGKRGRNIPPPSWYETRFTSALQQHDSFPNYCFNIFICLVHLLKLVVRRYWIHYHLSTPQQVFDSIFTLNSSEYFSLFFFGIVVFEYFYAPTPVEVCPLDDGGGDVKVSTMIRVKKRSESDFVSADSKGVSPRRAEKKCLELLKIGADLLSDDEVMYLVERKKLLPYRLEKDLQDANRAVNIRRKLFNKKQDITDEVLQDVPYEGYDFTIATKACCENTIGYIPVPVGLVGPLLLDGEKFMIPMATTEGTLLASTNRGLKALMLAGGVKSYIYGNGMTRSPVVEFPTVEECCQLCEYLQQSSNLQLIKERFDSTSRYAKLQRITTSLSGRLLFIRFVSTTGDAMGMNMVSKGAENSLRWLKEIFPSMRIISLSGNFCTDKKSSAVNWIQGRGRSVVCESIIPSKMVAQVLKTDMSTLVHLNRCKNHIGSAMAGSIGGFNAHAANIVTAIYIATGQDPAQVVVSANCMTTLEIVDEALVMTCTMPSVEVATVGGGTILQPQKACLQLLGVAGSHDGFPGENASKLARIVCGVVMGGELSLMSALSTGDLVRSHMKHNRLENNLPLNHTDHSIL